MGATQLTGLQVKDGSIQRPDLDVVTPSKAVITKIIQGTGISISSTGVDSGTGDVTVSATGTAPVTSVFGRTGVVIAQAGDYTPVQVGAEPALGTPAQPVALLQSNNSGVRAWATPSASLVGAEPALGNPSGNGFVLSSTTAGARSWIAPPTAPVASVFGRTGAVVAAANDYNFNQLAGSVAAAQLPAFTGDVTSPGGSAALTIGTGAVTYAKMQTVSTAGKLLGSATGLGPYPVGEISLGAQLSMNLSTLTVSAEPPLGNPSVNGQVLSSTTAGVRSWITPSGGGLGGTIGNTQVAWGSGTNIAGSANLTWVDGSGQLSIAGGGGSGYLRLVTNSGTGDMILTAPFATCSICQNAYYSGGWKYLQAAAAAQIQLSEGNNIAFSLAASGAAGGSISWTQVLALYMSGGVGIGGRPDPGAGYFDVPTGYKIGGGASANSYLRSNGTAFVASGIAISDLPLLAGDVTGAINGNTVGKVNGVSYPASPAVGTTPYVTATNTIQYKSPGQFQNASGLSPAGTVSNTMVMCGMGSSVPFTPSATGTVLVVVTFRGLSNASNTYGGSQIRYGTGTAPANGAAASGTATGPICYYPQTLAAGTYVPMAQQTMIANLTVGTAYWFDLSILSNTTNNYSVTNVFWSIIEI